MTPLQWALLVVGAIAVVAIYVVSRRERPVSRPRSMPTAGGSVPSPADEGVTSPAKEQMDMFPRMGEFDEFGVGKPRKRVAPSAAPSVNGEKAATAAAPIEEKLVALLIAEREGTAIFGPKIHAALRSQGLTFGDRRIYHRTEDKKTVFSVASLVKPGVLDPADEDGFSTPGLSMFMVLPGPVGATAALNDLIGTARSLAKRLNAEVFDSNRQLLTPELEADLKADIEAWAHQPGVAGQ